MIKPLSYFLTNLDRLEEISVDDIKSLIKKSPYNENLRLLLAKKLTLESEIVDLDSINNAAMYSTDRAKLHQVLYDYDEKDKDTPTLHTETDPITTETEEESLSENIELKNEEPEIESVIDKQDKEVIQIQEIALSEDQSTETIETAESFEEEKKIELDLESTISTNLDVEHKEQNEVKEEEIINSEKEHIIEKKKKKRKKKKIKVFYVDDEHSIEQMEKELIQESNDVIPKAKKQKDIKFYEWLSGLDKNPISSESNIPNPDTETTKNKSKSKSKDKKKKKEKKKSKKAKKLSIISETLASLLVKQGHKKKAIKMYKELSLKNPEKNSYFAAQIDKLKESDKK